MRMKPAAAYLVLHVGSFYSIFLQFIATWPAVIMAPFLGHSLGLYYSVKTITALELAFSLSSPVDCPVSMDTWHPFPLQSVIQRLQINYSSVFFFPIWAVFYFCFVTTLPFHWSNLFSNFIEGGMFLLTHYWIPCRTICVHVSGELRWDRIAFSPPHHREVNLLREIQIEALHLAF